MLVLTPTAFELAVCDLLSDMGFKSVRRVGGAGDLSVDVTARDEKGKSVAVQCKRYAPGNQVGSRDVQQFIGMAFTHHKVDRKLYVTTSGFTRAAAELGNKHGIELIDGDCLARLLLEHRGAEEGVLESKSQIGELLDLAAAGVIDLDRVELQLDPSMLREMPDVSAEELEETGTLSEHDARALGLPVASSPNFNPAAGDALPIHCFRCGGTMTWEMPDGGYRCPDCGRHIAFDGKDFRVANTGIERDPGALRRGPQFVSPQGYTTPVLPYTTSDGTSGFMSPPLDMAKKCATCSSTMEATWSLPGYHCWSCGRSEMYADAITLQVLDTGVRQT
jgi:DNA-directed RNA polymerase subunit RPC12/RpoP